MYSLFDKHAAATHTDSATLKKKETRSSDKFVPTNRIHGATSHKPVIFTHVIRPISFVAFAV